MSRLFRDYQSGFQKMGIRNNMYATNSAQNFSAYDTEVLILAFISSFDLH